MSLTISTILTARVGYSGTKTHRVHASVMVSGNPKRLGEAVVLAGGTSCGSQRWGSGSAMLPVGTPITCERCNKRPAPVEDRMADYGNGRMFLTVADPNKAITTDRRGTLVPTEWAAEQVLAAEAK